MIDCIQLLKVLVETDIGVNKDRQKVIVQTISKKMSKQDFQVDGVTRMKYILLNTGSDP